MTSNTKATTSTIPAHLGLATLLRLNMAGADLSPLGQALIARASEDATDACSLLDAGIICQFHGQPVLAQHLQNEALNMQQHYCLPAQRLCRLRLLALVVPGDLMANVPLECLLEDADVELNLYYTLGTPIAYHDLPAHDVLFVAIGGSTANTPILEAWAKHLENWPKPVLNRPAMIAHLARDTAADLLQDVPGLLMPKTQRIAHQTLLHSAQNNQLPSDLSYPLIVRPIDSHAGHDLNKIDNAAELISALAKITEESLFVAPLIDYRSPDGLFRKYRIVLINDAAFACHMGISEHWMIHYLNAGMAESPVKRAEEAEFMAHFEQNFAARHQAALTAIKQRIGLDYLGIDCAEMPDGRLLVFEVDHAMIVHAMDPIERYPYKQAPMKKVFTAFRSLLFQTANIPT